MFLLAIVIVGLAIFSFLEGYYVIGIISLFGFSSSYGMIALIITAVFLILQGHLIIGILPLLLIIWNIISLLIFSDLSLTETIGKTNKY